MLIDEEIWVKTWADSMRTKRTYYDSIKPLYDLQRYKSELSSMLDSDSDGIPDAIETHGMITNTGRIIYTDPNKKDTDGDGLSDGYEMGEISVTKKIFDRSYFYNYIDMWSLEMGYRYWEYVYYEMKTDPTKYSSDSDNAGDGNDTTPHDENEPVNYILYYKDIEIIGNFGNMEEYCLWFFLHGMNYRKFEINSAEEFDCFWKNMCHECTDYFNVTDACFTDKEEFSCVKNLVVIFHGDPDKDQLVIKTKEGWKLGLSEEYVEETVKLYTKYNIDCINLQSCYGNRNIDNDKLTVAKAFLASKKVKRVYASNGPMSFIPIININTTNNGNCIFLIERDRSGVIQEYPIGQSTFLMLLEW